MYEMYKQTDENKQIMKLFDETIKGKFDASVPVRLKNTTTFNPHDFMEIHEERPEFVK